MVRARGRGSGKGVCACFCHLGRQSCGTRVEGIQRVGTSAPVISTCRRRRRQAAMRRPPRCCCCSAAHGCWPQAHAAPHSPLHLWLRLHPLRQRLDLGQDLLQGGRRHEGLQAAADERSSTQRCCQRQDTSACVASTTDVGCCRCRRSQTFKWQLLQPVVERHTGWHVRCQLMQHSGSTALTSADLSFFLFMAASSVPAFCFLPAPLIPPLWGAWEEELSETLGRWAGACLPWRREQRLRWRRKQGAPRSGKPRQCIQPARIYCSIKRTSAGLTPPGNRFRVLGLVAAALRGPPICTDTSHCSDRINCTCCGAAAELGVPFLISAFSASRQ